VQFDDHFLKNLKAPATGSKFYFDDQQRGLAVRINSNGVVSFVLNYFTNGSARRMVIGHAPDLTIAQARTKAEQLRTSIKLGHDPLGAQQQKAEQKRAELPASKHSGPRVSDLAREYLAVKQPKRRASTLRNDRSMLDKIIFPAIGTMRVRSVRKADIERLHASLSKTPYRANRVLSLLSSMFSTAVANHDADENPVKGIERYFEDKRETWLPLEQLQKLTAALDLYPDQVAAAAIRLLIVTGSREMEVLSAEWSHFDLKRGMWVKPSHHTKQKKTEHVPLNDAALAILSTLPRSGR
jgi:integrase